MVRKVKTRPGQSRASICTEVHGPKGHELIQLPLPAPMGSGADPRSPWCQVVSPHTNSHVQRPPLPYPHTIKLSGAPRRALESERKTELGKRYLATGRQWRVWSLRHLSRLDCRNTLRRLKTAQVFKYLRVYKLLQEETAGLPGGGVGGQCTFKPQQVPVGKGAAGEVDSRRAAQGGPRWWGWSGGTLGCSRLGKPRGRSCLPPGWGAERGWGHPAHGSGWMC